jgi:1,4-alpha-glucan branching enzyme
VKDLLLVLHAHLPWGHLADENDAAARWLLEASVDCYQPLLDALERLEADGVPFRITLSVSPPLAAMWASPLFGPRLARYVEGERAAYEKVPAKYAAAAAFHLERLQQPRKDLLTGFRRLKGLELICSTATHGFLPLLSTVPAAARAQVHVAAQSQAVPPPGMWLAECGYCDGADRWLLDAGATYCFVDSHALAHAEFKHHRAVRTPAGLRAFARDPQASEQVWSRESGYPGDRAYLDFHHRIGGCRVLKVPGDAPWDPIAARERARVHAQHFVEQRGKTEAEVIVAPYDAELFGHWWFEGPDFFEAVIREAAQSKTLKLATASDHVRAHPHTQTVGLPTSSWGRGGYSAVWLDATNAWMWPHLQRAAERLVTLASGEPTDRLNERALAQATRELLLAQASDWPFLLEAKTNAPYATERFEDHLLAFRALAGQLETNAIDESALLRREAANNLFGTIDARVYGGKSWPQR